MLPTVLETLWRTIHAALVALIAVSSPNDVHAAQRCIICTVSASVKIQAPVVTNKAI